MVFNICICSKCGWSISGTEMEIMRRTHNENGCDNDDLIYEKIIPSLTKEDLDGFKKLTQVSAGTFDISHTHIRDREGFEKVNKWIRDHIKK